MGKKLTDTDSSFRIGHRKRLQQKLADGVQLSDVECLELLLMQSIPRCDVKPYAHGLIKKYGGIFQVLTASMESLTENKGIKTNTATMIKVIQNIMLRGYQGGISNAPIFHNYDMLLNYCRLNLMNKPIEEFHVLYLNSSYQLIVDDMHSRGTTNWAAVYPMEIAKRAIALDSKSVVLIHNHPTTDQSFSSEDADLTTLVQQKLKNLDIELFDHLLIAGGIVYSAKEKQLIRNTI